MPRVQRLVSASFWDTQIKKDAAGTTIRAAAARKLPIMPIAELVATWLETVLRRFITGKAIKAISKAKAQ